MKEVMAFLRPNKVNATKKALADAGHPSFSCRKCLGRGRQKLDAEALQMILDTGAVPANAVGEQLSEGQRLIAKRFFLVIVPDGQVKEVVDTIIEANQTGNPGDGKIFVLPIDENYTVRTGESTTENYSY